MSIEEAYAEANSDIPGASAGIVVRVELFWYL